MNQFKQLSLVAFCLICLASVVSTQLLSAADDVAVAGESTIDGVLLTNAVSVTRAIPFTDVDDLRTDQGVARVVEDITEYCQGSQFAIDADGLERYLEQDHTLVGDPIVTEEHYEFVVDGDGVAREICYIEIKISVDDGGTSLIEATVHSSQVL